MCYKMSGFDLSALLFHYHPAPSCVCVCAQAINTFFPFSKEESLWWRVEKKEAQQKPAELRKSDAVSSSGTQTLPSPLFSCSSVKCIQHRLDANQPLTGDTFQSLLDILTQDRIEVSITKDSSPFQNLIFIWRPFKLYTSLSHVIFIYSYSSCYPTSLFNIYFFLIIRFF